MNNMQLDKLPLGQMAHIDSVNWADIPDGEAHRLRSLGLDEGVSVEALHRGILFFRDPIAVRVGRMTIALRSKVAKSFNCVAIDR